MWVWAVKATILFGASGMSVTVKSVGKKSHLNVEALFERAFVKSRDAKRSRILSMRNLLYYLHKLYLHIYQSLFSLLIAVLPPFLPASFLFTRPIPGVLKNKLGP